MKKHLAMLAMLAVVAAGAGVVGGATGCGGDGATASDPTIPAPFGAQPPLVPAGIAESLGATLGATAGATVATERPQAIRQVVAGAAHLCVLDEAGAAFCIADSPLAPAQGSGGAFPGRWTRVENAPVMAVLFAAGDTTCGAPLGGGLHCWGGAVFSPPEFASFVRAREIVRGEVQVVGVVSAEGPWSARRICIQTAATRVSCDLAGAVAHVDFPATVADPVVIGGVALGRVGEVVYRANISTGATTTATPDAGFPRVVSLAAVTPLLACGVTAGGEGHCVSADGDEPAGTLPPDVPFFTVEAGSTLGGDCVRGPSGAVRCGIFAAGEPRGCDLGLLRIQAVGGRACGPVAPGEWRCLGRRGPAAPRMLPGLVDHAACPR